MASAFAASLAITPVVRRAGDRTWVGALRVTVALGVVAVALAAVGRAWIPPAPLFMARAAILWDVLDLDNVEALSTTLSAAAMTGDDRTRRDAMAEMVRTAEYFYVMVPDKPGEGARILGELKRAGVNLVAYSGFPSGRGAQLDLVPTDPAAFKALAKEKKWKV